MVKVAQRYLEVHPWKIIEKGYHKERHQVSESLFSLSNEYMGVRGFFEEGTNEKELIGTYFNGIYETPKNITKSHYKGITDKQHYMVNSINFFYLRIYLDDQLFIFNEKDINDFYRELDLKTGESIRRYQINDLVEITLRRLLDINQHELSFQVIEIKPIQFKGKVTLDFGLNLNEKHWNQPSLWKVLAHGPGYLLGETTTNQKVYTTYNLESNVELGEKKYHFHKKCGIETVSFTLEKKVIIKRNIIALIDKKGVQTLRTFKDEANKLADQKNFSDSLLSNQTFYENFFKQNDIIIEGDPLNQQGIRYCLFQLVNTYHGVSPTNNIGAKGLTGESYSGHAFWDSETYCLPFYLFTNPQAAKNLLMFRYNTLDQARARAQALDCRGACYPIATLNGHEGSDLWQHASLQFQPSTGIYYAIWHYVKNTNDQAFLIHYGFEMMLEIARFLSSRGQYNQDGTKFGYYGVMGPDEFQMMVNHNTYTNLLGKQAMGYFLELKEVYQDHPHIQAVLKRLNFSEAEAQIMKDQMSKMVILYDEKTKLFEQHQGFFDLPHIDINSIPVTDFPLYSHWSYDRIYRNDLIKQPDVLMFLFLFNQTYHLDIKKANFDYYEPKTLHESSLSPSVHAILAAEIGYHEQALKFFGFASRLDLDDYNRNTNEGLHMTSIAAAWVTIVYGFGGLRSDGKYLKLAPMLPQTWQSYRFHITYFGVSIEVIVKKEMIELILDQDLEQPIMIYEKVYQLKKGLIQIERMAH